VEYLKILILVCDGYLGWPTTLRMISRGHEVFGVDDFSKRRQLRENKVISAFESVSIKKRIEYCKTKWKKTLKFYEFSVTDKNKLPTLIKKIRPQVIFDFAQIPSAPYSYGSLDKCIETWRNNTEGTLNLLWAMRQYAPKAHLVKLGTMGEYGTPSVPIPEGKFTYSTKDGKYHDILSFPRQAGSFYHQSKVADTHNIEMACNQWNLRCTDIMQGIIYGTRSEEDNDEKHSRTVFYFDEMFGTVINRMLASVVCKHPLPVYGTGGMTRGILSLRDAIDCYELIIKNPTKLGEHLVINQFDESKRVLDIASIIASVSREFGYKPTIKHYKSPRVEKQRHFYLPVNSWLRSHGYKRHMMFEDIVSQMLIDLVKVKQRIIKYRHVIPPKTTWK